MNQAYVIVSSRKFEDAASALVKGIQQHGYSAKHVIQKGKKSEEINVFNKKKEFAKENIKIPFFAINVLYKHHEYSDQISSTRKLSYYEDLIGKEFDLTKQKIKDKFDFHHEGFISVSHVGISTKPFTVIL